MPPLPAIETDSVISSPQPMKASFFEDFFSKNAHPTITVATYSTDNYHKKCHFTFTGKERDAETGYSDHGARYLDHALLTCWLSPDPLADKYPNISPYAYCAWNPVIIIDPDGEDGRVVVKKEASGQTSINISTTIYLRSNSMTAGKLKMLAKDAQFAADKLLKPITIDKCEVSFNIQYKVYNGETIKEGDNILNINPYCMETSMVYSTKETMGGLVTGGLAGNEGQINADILNSFGLSRGMGFLHETLHFLGISDRYSGNECFKGFENDIMGLYARNANEVDISHYKSFVDKYKNADISNNPYLLLREKIDVLETEKLKRVNSE